MIEAAVSVKIVPMVRNGFGNTHYVEVETGGRILHREFRSADQAHSAVPVLFAEWEELFG